MRIAHLKIFLVTASILFASCAGCGRGSSPKKIQPCGNGVVDDGETCDTDIPEGQPGACPTECPQTSGCMTYTLMTTSGACSAECVVAEAQCGEADSCCPAGCTESEDDDCSAQALCGNGVLDPGEACDPAITAGRNGECACPPPIDACTRQVPSGDTSRCELTCNTEQTTSCSSGDGCCPAGCTAGNDTDCGDTCGDGIVGPTELCDSNCPTDCDDGDVCTTDTRSGSSSTCDVQCTNAPITACVSADGCCPNGCTAATDSDCSATCGDGVLDPGETCDGDCPSDCNDMQACTSDTRQGSESTCSVVCINDPITTCTGGDGCCPANCTSVNDSDCSMTCGNNVVEQGETCDGNCPTDCDDFDACTVDTLQGSAANCSATCTYAQVTACIDDDGCCPAACDASNDNDCSATCGNGVVEPGETCDGDCPTSCDDGDACTVDTLNGSASNCSATCNYNDVTQCTSGDGCCPSNCTFDIDDDCPCMPDTCASLGWTCGTIADDGCGGGGEVCGTCADAESCVAGGCESNEGIGDACVDDLDCAGTADDVCISEVEYAWNGGYCTRACVADTDCGAPNHCASDGLCLRSCASDDDCRSDYACYDTDGDGQNECAPLANGTGAPGDPCSAYTDCAGGTDGFCSRADFKDGFCSQDCLSNADCPAATHCSIHGFCVPDCTDSTDCRGNGYECFDYDQDASTECFRYANGAGAVGDPCVGMWECAGDEYGLCASEEDGWPGGYCLIDCGPGQGTCPTGSACFDAAELCVDTCQNDNQCRAGYQCADPGGLGMTACIR